MLFSAATTSPGLPSAEAATRIRVMSSRSCARQRRLKPAYRMSDFLNLTPARHLAAPSAIMRLSPCCNAQQYIALQRALRFCQTALPEPPPPCGQVGPTSLVFLGRNRTLRRPVFSFSCATRAWVGLVDGTLFLPHPHPAPFSRINSTPTR